MVKNGGLLIRLGRKGFTLIELLVSVAIMTIILGITLSGGPQSIMKLTLTDNAYKSELMIRESQLQGSAVNSFGGLFGGVGVYFDLATSSVVQKFRDKVDPGSTRAIKIGNGLYDQSVTEETGEALKLTNNHRVGKLCVARGIEVLTCNEDNTPTVKNLTISFSRPKQTANIYINNDAAESYSVACVQFDSLKSPSPGYVRSVYVYRSGMIVKKLGTCI